MCVILVNEYYYIGQNLSVALFVHSGDNINAADLSSSVFKILKGVTWTKSTKSNPLSFHKFHPELANSDITKEALNCTVSL